MYTGHKKEFMGCLSPYGRPKVQDIRQHHSDIYDQTSYKYNLISLKINHIPVKPNQVSDENSKGIRRKQ